MRNIFDILTELLFVLEQRYRYKNKVMYKNNGFIQFNDFTIIHRIGWQDLYTIEEMDEFLKEAKNK